MPGDVSAKRAAYLTFTGAHALELYERRINALIGVDEPQRIILQEQ